MAQGNGAKLAVSSTAFADGQPIPVKYTCQGDDISPPLHWDQPPPAAKSFVLICDDPDAPAGSWVHWVLYNLPASIVSLPENTPPTEILPEGARQGSNSFDKIGYGGPCPPKGKAHRYFFKVYALDITLSIEGHSTKEQVLDRMQGHIVAEGQLMGLYRRQ